MKLILKLIQIKNNIPELRQISIHIRGESIEAELGVGHNIGHQMSKLKLNPSPDLSYITIDRTKKTNKKASRMGILFF